ncbi:MAG: Hpt domain-containing protein [Hyphomicrobium sp.]|nr:Hpt domain-containing protein [Hyphomicrobium sp.]
MFENGEVRRCDVPVGGNTDRASPYPIDHDHLRRYAMGDRQLELEVLHLFAGELPKTIRALRDARTDMDWKVAAHTLKGSARAVGAWRVAAAAVAAEKSPQIVYDMVGKAESLTACETAATLAIAYIRGLT